MRKLFFPLLLFVSGLLSAQTEITLYVSPSGSDHHPGTAEKPMATLEYAWKKASRQPAGVPSPSTAKHQLPVRSDSYHKRDFGHTRTSDPFFFVSRTKGGHQRFAYTPEPALERV